MTATPAIQPPHRPVAVRVLYVEANEDGTVGGSYQILYDLVRSVDRSRYDPLVLFYQDNPFADRLRALGIAVIIYDRARARERTANTTRGVAGRRAEQLVAIWRRYRLLRRERIGLVHLNNSPAVGSDDWLPAAMLAGVPCIVSAMGLVSAERSRLRRALGRRFAHVIALSDSVSASLQQFGMPATQITRVYPGIDIPTLRSAAARPRAEVRRELGIDQASVLVAMVGNIRRWKGQHVVVAALSLMPAAVRDRIRVIFIGGASAADHAYDAELRASVERNQLGHIVQFLGTRSDVPALLAASDVAVHASTAPEPFGLVVTEAMVLGRAVVATSIGGPAEMLTPGSGLLFDPQSPQELADRLTAVVMDPELRVSLGRGALERAEHFSLPRHVAGVTGVYERVLGAR
jgi:glycosyltransferase involved in cell wall biosynthesis